MKFPRVLAESEDFFAGLQHPDSPVQIRSAPLRQSSEINSFRTLFLFHAKLFRTVLWKTSLVLRENWFTASADSGIMGKATIILIEGVILVWN